MPACIRSAPRWSDTRPKTERPSNERLDVGRGRVVEACTSTGVGWGTASSGHRYARLVDPSFVPERVEVSEGAEVVINWEDGTVSRYSASQLRAACQCAECREPFGQKKIEEVLAGPEPVTITTTKLVGGYAVNFVFSPDAHSTGIFSFPALYALGHPPEKP